MSIHFNAEVAPEIFRQRGWNFRQGAKMIQVFSFRTSFCQICYDNNLKFPPMGGGGLVLPMEGL